MFKIIKEAEENEEYFAIYTDGETYPVVKRDGEYLIARQHSSDFSGQWKFLGVVDRRKPTLRLDPEDTLKISDWKFKNGNPRYAVVDYDHGSTRVWAHGSNLRSFDRINRNQFEILTSK